ncbi:MAG: tail fiber protein [Hydrotalea sp. AMD]|nr:MAG: tail fiber protein [Hydrotalea sp. AMD]
MTGITDPLTTSVNTALNQVVPIGGIIMWSGSTVPTGWHICDGTNGTPNLIDRFIVGSGGIHPVGSNGAGSTVAVTSTPPTATLPPFYALAFIMKM